MAIRTSRFLLYEDDLSSPVLIRNDHGMVAASSMLSRGGRPHRLLPMKVKMKKAFPAMFGDVHQGTDDKGDLAVAHGTE